MSIWARLRSIFNKNDKAFEEMQYLIVGLGNIGSEYDNTRHNIGFDVLDSYADDSPYEVGRLAHYHKMRKKNKQPLLIKPTTYMNRSGKAVDFWMKQAKIPIDRVLVVVDDLNLPFGALRFRAKGSNGGHNGLKDIEAVLGRSDYARIRFGIGSDYARGRQVDFVLGKWNAEEQEVLAALIDHTHKMIDSWMFAGNQAAMQLNKKG